SASDFQISGDRLVKYNGTAEIVSVPDEVKIIGEEAFADNNYIVKVNTGDRVKTIEYGAFSNCKALHTVNISDRTEEIGQAAFSKCPNLKNLSIGSGVKNLGSAVFAGDNSLTNITVSENNPYIMIDGSILYNKDKSRLYCMLPSYGDGIYNMPNSVDEIAGYAFWGNTSIKNVTLSSNLYSIPEYTFSNCVNLRQVEVPLPVHSIDAKAFEDCVNLSLVELPDSINNIHESAFDGCPNVTFKSTPGTYASNFANERKKDEVSEVEHEDVDASKIVTSQTVVNFVPKTIEGNEYEVVVGAPDNTNGDNTSSGSGQSSTGSGQSSSVDPKYKGGVIDGKDVVTYTYYDTETEPSGSLLGQSSIVGGRALVFIDNNAKVKNSSINVNVLTNGETGVDLAQSEGNGNVSDDGSIPVINALPENGSISEVNTEVQQDQSGSGDVGSIMADNAQKGKEFPKYTVVNNRIASQAYYMDTALDEYEFPEGITSIGDFSFARSGLDSVKIPEGVTSIGYGAFYHCDDLNEVDIPSTVSSVGAYAFDETAFLKNNNDTFVVIGDGVLIGYNGSDSVVTIPEGVKLIADGTFRDHPGITAVNLPDSLLIIGEDAFSGCGNLRTLNRGENVTTIGANAFKGTALNSITINPAVKSIGVGAFDLNGGTDTVTLLGEELPALVSGKSASRLANSSDRTYVFGNLKKAIINPNIKNLQGTVLEPGSYGFKGQVVDAYGNTVSDNTQGVTAYSNNGILLDINSSVFSADASSSAFIAGDEGNYVLHLNDSQNAKENIAIAYADLYGGRTPENLIGFDLSLRDDSNTIAISKLGKQKVTVTLPLPKNIITSNLHMVSLDEDGQLEAVEYSITGEEDNKYISFECRHFSPYGLYNYGGTNGNVDKEGTRIKDDTPDTGDYSISPRWFLVIGCFAGAIALILISFKKKQSYN
ncbi:MAG: leucine-rich repeat domain-containing protein, partial [Lachnospiraceae bacterium]|nr:leucine-rich repeat domain-containing protein [Lachnospiraceae bacterium]